MSDITHEDRRIRVIQDLRNSILSAINNIKTVNFELYSELKLDEYEEILKRQKDVPLIIKNERIIQDVGRPDIEVFGGRLLIEIKKDPSEYSDGFNQLCKYEPYYSYAEYAILTNYFDNWFFYQINKNEEDNRLSQIDVELVDIIQRILIKGVRIDISTENIKNLFKPIILAKNDLIKIFESNNIEEDALYKAYTNIIERLYEDATKDKLKELFILHTLIQMTVSACLTVSFKIDSSAVKACLGSEIRAEIVLPYMKWWDSLILRSSNSSGKSFIESLINSIYSKSLLLNWETGVSEDVFRELYEILIDTDTRRVIGEYYTPFWVTEYMTNRLNDNNGDIKDKTILDPFCGSGTFLISCFYKKISLGEDIDNALNEILGFDINPIAVSIARAELMIAYHSLKHQVRTPLIFNIDSASLLLQKVGEWKEISFLEELRKIEKRLGFIDHLIFQPSKIDFKEILKIEVILRECFNDVLSSENILDFLDKKLEELFKEKWEGNLTSGIVKVLRTDECLKPMANLIKKYGNGVWAVSLTSLMAPHIIKRLKVDIIITNPPWNQLSKLKGNYGKLIRSVAKGLIKDYQKPSQIISGSDISSVLLYGSKKLAKEQVAFLMPQDNVYVTGSSYGLGKLLTYNSINNWMGEILEIPYDIFEHGRLPCMVFIKNHSGVVSCYKFNVKFNRKYSKSLRLEEVRFEISSRVNYKEYIDKVKSYLEYSTDDLKELLKVDDVVPMGDFIRGVYGKENEIAGLIFSKLSFDESTEQFYIKLSNLKAEIPIPKHILLPYWKKLIYPSELFPFYLDRTHNILLSSIGQEDLKNFLEQRILPKTTKKEKLLINKLIENLKQSSPLNPIQLNCYYVLYRRIRTFATTVLTPEDLEIMIGKHNFDIIIYDVCSYITSTNKELAFYYMSILNYLALKVITLKGKFERNLYVKPLISIVNAGLEWKSEKWQKEVSKLGQKIFQNSPNCYEGYLKKGVQVSKCFERLNECDRTGEFLESLIEIVDNNVNIDKLREALKTVAIIR